MLITLRFIRTSQVGPSRLLPSYRNFDILGILNAVVQESAAPKFHVTISILQKPHIEMYCYLPRFNTKTPELNTTIPNMEHALMQVKAYFIITPVLM